MSPLPAHRRSYVVYTAVGACLVAVVVVAVMIFGVLSEGFGGASDDRRSPPGGAADDRRSRRGGAADDRRPPRGGASDGRRPPPALPALPRVPAPSQPGVDDPLAPAGRDFDGIRRRIEAERKRLHEQWRKDCLADGFDRSFCNSAPRP